MSTPLRVTPRAVLAGTALVCAFLVVGYLSLRALFAPKQPRAELAWAVDSAGPKHDPGSDWQDSRSASMEGGKAVSMVIDDEPLSRVAVQDAESIPFNLVDVVGTTIFPSGFNYSYDNDPIIVSAVSRAGLLASSTVSPDGTWAMAALKWSPDVLFELEGGGLVGLEHPTPLPIPGKKLVVELYPQLGHDLWFFVEDELGSPIPDAHIALTSSVLEHELIGSPRDDGYIRLRGCPAGLATATAAAPGYAAQRKGPISVPQLEPATWTFALSAARSLAIRCTSAEGPVEDFSVTWWPNQAMSQANTSYFSNASDGRAVLPDLPLTPLSLLAISPGLGSSDLVVVDADATQVLVELKLSDSVIARGIVVDARDGHILPDSQVQLVALSERGHPGASLAAPVPLKADGSFEAAVGSGSHLGLLIVGPEGYAHRVFALSRDQSGEMNLGVVELQRSSTLTVALAPSLLDPGSISIQGAGDSFLPERRFEPSGTVSYRDISWTRVCLEAYLPDASILSACLGLSPGLESSLLLPVGDCELKVRVIGWPESRSPSHLRATHSSLCAFLIPVEGVESHLRHMSPGSYLLEGINSKGTVSSSEVVISGPLTTVELRPSENRQLVIVDDYGRPVPGAQVQLRDLDSSVALASGATDRNGVFEFVGGTASSFTGYVFRVDLGAHNNFLMPPGSKERFTLHFAPSLELAITVADASGAPIGGVVATLRDPVLTNPLGAARHSSDDGLTSWTTTASSSFRVTLEKPGFWPRHLSNIGPGSHVFEMWERVDAAIELRNPDGSPRSEAPFELVFEPTGENVSKWHSGFGVETFPTGLVTDHTGCWRAQGIPAGRYWVSATSSSTATEIIVRTGSEPLVVIVH